MNRHGLMFVFILVIASILPVSPQNDCQSYSFITEGLIGFLVNGYYDVTSTPYNGRPVYSYTCATLFIYYMNTSMWILGAEIGSEAGFAYKESQSLDSADPWWIRSIDSNQWVVDGTAKLTCPKKQCRHIRVRGTLHDIVNADYISSDNNPQREPMYKHVFEDLLIKQAELPTIEGKISTGWTFQHKGELLMYSQYTSCGPIHRHREWLVQKNSVITIHNDITITCLDSDIINKEENLNDVTSVSPLANQSIVTGTSQPITTEENISSANSNNISVSSTSETTVTSTDTSTVTSTGTSTVTTLTSTVSSTLSTVTSATTAETTEPPTVVTSTATTPRVYDPKDEAFPYQPIGCGVRQASAPSLFIVGATDVPYEGKWPWMVAIFDSANSFICSGALISVDRIITAGHCFAGQKHNSTHYIVLGAYDLSKASEPNRQMSNISRWTVHHNYSRRTQGSFRVFHDIAMAVLTSPVKINAYVNPICLPANAPDVATDCFIAGYGQRGYTGSVGTLQHDQTTNIMNISRCARLLSAGWMTNTSTFCATPANHAKICKGDSGSPLMCRFSSKQEYSIVGLASWSLTICLLSDFPSIYVNVYDYLQWLYSVW